MTCEEFKTLLQKKGCASLTDEAKAHLAACERCKADTLLDRDLDSLYEDEPVPFDFQTAWRARIRKESPMKNWLNRKAVRVLATAAAAVLVFMSGVWFTNSLPRNGASSQMAKRQEDGVGMRYMSVDSYSAPAGEAEEQAVTAPEPEPGAGRNAEARVIRRVDIAKTTVTYEEDSDAVMAALRKSGGYVERSSEGRRRGNRYISLELRVPKDRLDAFLADIKGVGRDVSVTEAQEDVSERYYDTAGRLETQKNKLNRLNELLKKAVTVSDMIEIESALADTQYQIDSLTGSLRGMDSKVNLSPVTLTLTEEKPQDTAQQAKTPLGERIAAAFSYAAEATVDFLADAAVFAVVALPYLAVLAAIILIIRMIVKRRKNK